uniref:Uncharacterized protein n=1 Tax=Candidatus Kentrum sp. LPFa TaxID=2126335 RepID=A0A450VRJ1_9GAMM|nr:MAG: hypothetical protein BECKLPF1236A_GA0070988_100098 [Candidatus Kentron sp. LPFa]VFK24224.1 MAG: hypothetical protein BECKLPF1236C_GA0070990_1001116 [Candidatus Kentron sp. LPFa]
MIKRKNSNLLLVLIFKGIRKIKILVSLVRIPRSTPCLSWREAVIYIPYVELVRYLENFRQNDQEILNKGGWGPAKRAPQQVACDHLGSRFAGPQPHKLSATFSVPALPG